MSVILKSHINLPTRTRSPAFCEPMVSDPNVPGVHLVFPNPILVYGAPPRHPLAAPAVFGPISRIPTELLATIFGMCSGEARLVASTTTEMELDRLAKRYLLEVSQVCSSWHAIALETPRLWSDLTFDTRLWHASTAPIDTFLSLLETSLLRGRNHRLSIRFAVDVRAAHARQALSLLCEHAQRWESLGCCTFGGNPKEYLNGAIGNLPSLKVLHYRGIWEGIDAFDNAPALSRVTLLGQGKDIALPWAQISTFTYCCGPDATAVVPGSARFLGPTSEFIYALELAEIHTEQEWPAMELNVGTLNIRVSRGDSRAPLDVLRQIFRSWTLPHVLQLSVMPRKETPPVWNEEHFLDLARRSSFRTHLTILHLCVVITDDELLRCLFVLPLLEQLVLSERAPHIFITDRFLRGIAVDPNSPPIVPRLTFLSLTTVRRFSDDAYSDCLRSRSTSRGVSFRTELELSPHAER
ncbi:hypothetical protein C8F04DRAFT_1273960 [Mycena alexandri]|uniref:F-box domain-containing protein n=1 Tax=Mycena alexandri TaxID=1745969 RepID=A0AAD6WQC7_9AGAR|nr:hypothetical protein C8F04DRAFT_1273960 [Mycena alexandri]